MQDPYEILGVEKTATQDEIRKAYRKLAKTLHPDLNPGDKVAEARFKQVGGAYDLLSDEEKRKRFDAGEIDASGAERAQQHFYKDFAGGRNADGRYRSHAGFADFGDASDIFAEIFRQQAEAQRNAPGADMRFRLNISFLDAINGANQRLTLPSGNTIDVKIPAGVKDGQTIRLKGKGAPSPGEGPPGDAYVELSVSSHPYFERKGDDILLELPITLKEAVLGGKVKAPTPTGAVMVTVPKGANTGTVLRLKGKGAPKSGGHGDELVRLKVVMPAEPDEALEKFVESWEPGADYDPRKDMGL